MLLRRFLADTWYSLAKTKRFLLPLSLSLPLFRNLILKLSLKIIIQRRSNLSSCRIEKFKNDPLGN